MGRLVALVPLAVAVALGAGAASCTATRSSPATEAPRKVRYVCDGGVELAVTYVFGDPGAARVELKGQKWELPHVRSGSGARYSDGTVTFWNKGREGMFEAPATRLGCTER